MGIPPGGVALILGVDRILDMSRTTANVTGDLVACTLMNRWIKPEEPEAAGGPDVAALTPASAEDGT